MSDVNIVYMRLAEPPEWCISYPTCSACVVDLDYDEDWICPSCGTTWPGGAGDGETGELADGLTGQVVSNDDAWRFARNDLTPREREQHIASHLEQRK